MPVSHTTQINMGSIYPAEHDITLGGGSASAALVPTQLSVKSYVDSVANGLDVKDSCKAATTGNITIATALNNGDTLDGVTLANNDRVLVKDQSTASENGIYIVSASPARASDLAAGSDAAGTFTFVEQGTVNGDNGFVCTSNTGSAVTGTNNLAYSQFSGAGQITAGDGLEKSGNTLSIDAKSNSGIVIDNTELSLNLGASSITGTLAVSDGGTGSSNASGARTNLGLAIGTNVQAYDAQLADIAGLTPTDGNFIVGDGTNFVLENGTTARASLGLAIGTNVQAYDADLTSLSSCQSGAAAALASLTSTEVAILDGATVTTDELNIIDGDTNATSTVVADADRVVMNDNGTMKQVAVTDLAAYFDDEITAMPNLTTIGAIAVCPSLNVQGAINASGDITAFKTSDKRLKENIKSIEDPLAKVKTIGGYTYTWNKLGEENSIHKLGEADVGVIAQEIEEIIPEAVADRGNGYKAVQYEKIIPLLVECVKEQQDMIEKLQNDLNMLKQ